LIIATPLLFAITRALFLSLLLLAGFHCFRRLRHELAFLRLIAPAATPPAAFQRLSPGFIGFSAAGFRRYAGRQLPAITPPCFQRCRQLPICHFAFRQLPPRRWPLAIIFFQMPPRHRLAA